MKLADAIPRPLEAPNVTLHLVLPLPPNRANDRSHWRKVHNQKSSYYGAAWTRILQQTTPQQRADMATGSVYVKATLYVWSMMDDDNATARLKWVLDSLKLAGVVRDDKRPWLRLLGIPEQEIDRTRQRVELWLEPAA